MLEAVYNDQPLALAGALSALETMTVTGAVMEESGIGWLVSDRSIWPSHLQDRVDRVKEKWRARLKNPAGVFGELPGMAPEKKPFRGMHARKFTVWQLQVH